MKFYINRLVIWFEKEDKPQRRVVEFEKNRVNVITGSSSTGKSNILAIIDYCLLAENPKIVIPVINENAEWYGLEFTVGDKTMFIARKKPEIDTPESNLIMKDGKIPDDFYPSTYNIHINDARRKLDWLFGLKSADRRNPGIEDEKGNDMTVSYRSFFPYNAITEGIMTSPYIFTDVNFFDSQITKSVTGQKYLFDILLGKDNIRIEELNRKIEGLEKKKETQEKQGRKISRKTGAYKEMKSRLISLCQESGMPGDWSDWSMSDDELVGRLRDLVETLAPQDIPEEDKELEKQIGDLNTKVILLDNMKRAREEYLAFLKEREATVDKLKPITYLKENLSQMGISEWTKYILDSFETSLSKLQRADVQAAESAITEKAIADLEQEIDAMRKSITTKNKMRELTIEKNNQIYYAVGVIKSELPNLEKMRASIPEQADEYTTQDEANYHAYLDERNRLESEGTSAYHRINEVFNEVYKHFKYMEYYEGCKPKYNKEERKLELNDGRSILNYNNIGSQSNYMFLHLCFFLGLHRYLAEMPSDHIAQFLFIDQPSIPYYSGVETVKTTDEAKLKDAFAAINRFMAFVVGEKKEDFQVILIEHAPESYWTDLEYFKTTEQFVDGNALIPKEITTKERI